MGICVRLFESLAERKWPLPCNCSIAHTTSRRKLVTFKGGGSLACESALSLTFAVGAPSSCRNGSISATDTSAR